jgi:hypothetical protein
MRHKPSMTAVVAVDKEPQWLKLPTMIIRMAPNLRWGRETVRQEYIIYLGDTSPRFLVVAIYASVSVGEPFSSRSSDFLCLVSHFIS